MDSVLGLLRVKIRRGIDLAIRDSRTSDPYVVLTMAHQKLKSRVVENNCNPEWNDELTLSISDFETPITLKVYDEDTLSFDDKMGSALIDLKPLSESIDIEGLESLPDGHIVKKVDPSKENCLSEESVCVWKEGKIVQDMRLRLRDVESGEVVVQIEWIDLRGRFGASLTRPKSAVEASGGFIGLEATN